MIRSAAVVLILCGFAAATVVAQQTSAPRLGFDGGRVVVVAVDVPAATLLEEWTRTGLTRFEGVDETLAARRVTLQLNGVEEAKALEQIVGPGFSAVEYVRPETPAGLSQFTRVVLMAAPPLDPALPAAGSKAAFAHITLPTPTDADRARDLEPTFVPSKTIIPPDSILAAGPRENLSPPPGTLPPDYDPSTYYVPEKSIGWTPPVSDLPASDGPVFRPSKTLPPKDDYDEHIVNRVNCDTQPAVCRPYRAAADARRDIALALAAAATAKKSVVVSFGNNTCAECLAVNKLFGDPVIKPYLEKRYVLVHVDLGLMERNLDLAREYGILPTQDLPAVLILEIVPAASAGAGSTTRLLPGDELLNDLRFVRHWTAR